MIARFFAAASLTALALSTPVLAKTAPKAKAAAAAPADRTGGWGAFGVQTQNMNTAVKPGDDFNAYVNGKWLASTQIPADRTRMGSFIELDELSERRMHAIMEDLVAHPQAPGTPGARVAAAYQAFMDTAAIERAGLAPLQPYLTRIHAANTPEALVKLFAEPGIASPLGMGVRVDPKNSNAYVFGVGGAPLGLPDRDYYLVDSARNKDIQAKYKAYLTTMFTELGWTDPAGTAEAVYGLEARMAAANWDRAISRNRDLTYNKLTVDEFAALAPNVPLKAMLAAAGAGGQSELLVSNLPPTPEEIAAAKLTPEQVAKIGGGAPALARMIVAEKPELWQAWMAKNLIAGSASYLPKRIDDANFDFYGRTLSGQPEQRVRWKRAIDAVEGQTGELAGQLYAAKYFPAENKAAMVKLVANLRKAMALNLADLKWMGADTRVQAQAKLDAFTPKIGYPDKWKTYDGLVFGASAFDNAMAAGRWSQADDLSKLGKPVDKTEWGMLPETVNAYYNSTFNEIVFPAAILQPPFFNLKADDAVNYGAIGAVIGHEMGHGFDDQGSKSDGQGNLRDWWTASDKSAFQGLTDRLAKQYDALCPFDEGKTCVNGRLTLGENIGDLGGLSLAYRAYKMSLNGKPAPVIGGFTGDQRFFMAYAQVWREVRREAMARQLLMTDPHSPPEYRVNGIVRNFDEWARAFDVKPGDKLYVPPAERIRIW